MPVHQHGQFGPARGGPYGWRGKVLCCLAPLLTLGLLGMVPSLLLALRRRRALDVLGAVVFGGLQLGVYVSVGLMPNGSTGTTASPVPGLMLILLWLAAPAHYLLMDSRTVWGWGVSAQPRQQLAQQQFAQQQTQFGLWQPPFTPAPSTPASFTPPAAVADDLQQLGELLRRQAKEGRA